MSGEAPSAFQSEIRHAQARAAIGNVPTTIGSSTFLMLALSGVLWLDTQSPWIGVWLGAFAALSVYRAVGYARMRAAGADPAAADRVLRRLMIDSAVAGCLWAVVPLVEIGRVEGATVAFTTFIIVGTTSSVLTQNLAYAPPGILYFLPPLVATALMLFSSGSSAALIIGVNVVMMTLMMTRQALRSARAFRRGEELRLGAQSLAVSLAIANDEAVAANARLHDLATHDVLTALNNRAAFNGELADRFAAARAAGGPLALVVIDLDDFKMINDTQGHAAGDQVLTEVAARLAAVVDPGAFLARLGGDEFALIVSGSDVEARALSEAERMVEALRLPLDVGGRPTLLGASVGLALYPEHAGSPTDLMASADMALYDAKRTGKNRVSRYAAAMRTGLERRRRLESDIAPALAEGRIAVHFQPQVDLATRRIMGYEALVRWQHPELGSVAPPDIVAAALGVHVGDRLTAYVAERACRFVRALTAAGDGDSVVAVNVSPVEFEDSSPAGSVLAAAAAHGVDPRRLEVEITEEAILDLTLASAELDRLAAAGVRLAIDDFGAGYFSLASFSGLRLDRIKIDRSFVTAIDANGRHQMVVGTILALARKLEVVALAEGVETEAEALTLLRLGCTEAQGYLFGRPEAPEAALDRLAGEPAPRIGTQRAAAAFV